MLLRWIFCAAFVAATAATASAQPAQPDLAEAARLYHSAEQAMTERRYDDAARDYGGAYEISKDAVLFFKIGAALDKAGKCPVAVNYYRRYLREAKPSQEHQKLTSERIAVCEGQAKPATKPDDKAPTKPEAKPDDKAPAKPGDKAPAKPDDKAPAKPDDKAKATSGSAAGSGEPTPAGEPSPAGGGAVPPGGPGGATGAAPAATAEAATAEPQLAADGALARAAAELGDGSTDASPGSSVEGATGDAASDPAADPAAEVAAAPVEPTAEDSFPPPSPRRTAAWLSVGTGIAFVTIGAVLALSAESTEDDIADLYIVRPGGDPLTYDGRTEQRHDELVERGDRYQTLAWVSFGVAGVAAAAATYFFLTSPSSSSAESPPEKALALRPLVTRHGGGASATWQF